MGSDPRLGHEAIYSGLQAQTAVKIIFSQTKMSKKEKDVLFSNDF